MKQQNNLKAEERRKVTKVYMHAVTNVLGLSGVTELSAQKTPEFTLSEGEHGVHVQRGDLEGFIPYANIKVVYY